MGWIELAAGIVSLLLLFGGFFIKRYWNRKAAEEEARKRQAEEEKDRRKTRDRDMKDAKNVNESIDRQRDAAKKWRDDAGK